MKYCEKHNLAILPPDDSDHFPTFNVSKIHVWLNFKKISYPHLTWIDNSSLGKYSSTNSLTLLPKR